MVYDFDAELIEQALRQDAGALTCLRRELAEPPGVEEIAEALFAAVESHLGLEPVPSMPTPDEMDAIYEWDERLIADHAGSNRFHQVTA
jgi:hypothetical protein